MDFSFLYSFAGDLIKNGNWLQVVQGFLILGGVGHLHLRFTWHVKATTKRIEKIENKLGINPELQTQGG